MVKRLVAFDCNLTQPAAERGLKDPSRQGTATGPAGAVSPGAAFHIGRRFFGEV